MITRSEVRAIGLGLLPILLVVAAVHFSLREAFEAPKLWGDEEHYLGYAMIEAAQGSTSLMPGEQLFDHRPELTSRVFARLVSPGDLGDLVDLKNPGSPVTTVRTVRNIQAFQICLLLILVAITWIQARILSLGHGAAASAALIVGFFPWLAFHAHTLWPELLHGVLFGTALLCLTLHASRGALGWLVAAGLSLGFALLTKGTMLPLVPVACVLVAINTWRARDNDAPKRPFAGPLAATVFAAAVALVLAPQLIHNAGDGNGYRLSANRWWNLELGLTDLGELDPVRLEQAKRDGLPEGMVHWLPVIRTSMAYFEAADTPIERERLARERTLAHIEERGLLGIARDQIPKTLRVVFAPEPSFEQAITYRNRFGEEPGTGLTALRIPSRMGWYALLALALVAAIGPLRRDRRWQWLLLIVVYLFAAVTLVPVKFRFLLPVIPVLVPLACAGAARALASLRARSSPTQP